MQYDSRVKRQVELFTKTGEVTLCCHDADGLKVNKVEVQRTLRSLTGKLSAVVKIATGNYIDFYFETKYVNHALQQLTNNQYDLIVANDLNALPLAVELRNRQGSGKILFDAHEFSPLEFEDRWLWRIFLKRYTQWLARQFVPQTNAMTTVSWGVADAWKQFCHADATVIINAPQKYDIYPQGVEKGKIRLIHHGGANRSRKLEAMIALMQLLDERFTLDLVLIPGERRYFEKLQSAAKPLGKRIRFLKPVPSREVPKLCNQYDLGIYLIPPVNHNYQLALPNKFFEFIQGRIGVASYPIREIAENINKFSCGIVSSQSTVESMAESLNALTEEDVWHFKQNTCQAAEALCYEANLPRWKKVFQQLGISICAA